MALSERDNYLRTARFQDPEWIPARVSISGASWLELREDMEEVCARHPLIFPGFRRGAVDYERLRETYSYHAGETFTDAWQCVWRSTIDGLEGIVEGHPLADWGSLAGFQAPDPLVTDDRNPVDWHARRRQVESSRARGGLTQAGIRHGFLFMRMYYLRGFENLMLDFATEPPELRRLIDLIVAHCEVVVDQWCGMGLDLYNFAEDLGTQDRSVISPAAFRKWLTPAYRALMQPFRERGTLVGLHSDGYVMELMDEFIAAGVDIINPQDLCNGIDALASEVKGRMCIRLDIDRQTIVPFGTRAEIRELIAEETRKLGSPRGGLEFLAGIYPPTPPENVDALCDALEEYRTFWWDGRGG